MVMGTLTAYDQVTLKVKVPGHPQMIAADCSEAVHRGQRTARIGPRNDKLCAEVVRVPFPSGCPEGGNPEVAQGE